MTLAALILLCVCVLILGAIGPKPAGWGVVALAVVALLLVVLGGQGVSLVR
jgi:hypothetical protein